MVLSVMLYKRVLTFEPVYETIRIKASEQYFYVVLSLLLKMVVIFRFVDFKSVEKNRRMLTVNGSKSLGFSLTTPLNVSCYFARHVVFPVR